MTASHEPQRMCCFCRKRRPQKELIRIVKSPDGYVADPSGQLFGRSAYVCPERGCIDGMIRRRALDRSFRVHVSDSVYQELSKELEGFG